MNLRRLMFVLGLLPAAVMFAAAVDDLEFTGVMALPEKTSVNLTNKANKSSAWVAIGAGFAGYQVKKFDAKTETITVSKDGVDSSLRMKSAKVAEGAAPPPPPQRPPEVAIMNNLRQIAAAADQYYLENGKPRVTLADLVGPDKYIRTLVAVDGEDYSKLELEQGKELVIAFGDGKRLMYKR